MTSQLLFIGTTELLLIGGLALLLFGGKKLPEMMKGLGQGVQSFKKGMKEPLEEELEDDKQKKQKSRKPRIKTKQEQNSQTQQLLRLESQTTDNGNLLTFGGHLEVFRQMLFRILGVAGAFTIVAFCFKDFTWEILMAPSEWSFCTYRWIESAMQSINIDFHFNEFYVAMIATDLSSQFMTHITTSAYIGMLGASPYILYELFRFISPALYENERRYSVQVAGVIYVLFILGVLMSYFVLFPISFRFLGTYSVSARVVSNITIDSYISTFVSLTLVMGVVFQLPVIAFFLGKMGVITSSMFAKYRKHSFLVIMLVAAIITPPDLMTLILVTIPLYLLYEVSIRVVKIVE